MEYQALKTSDDSRGHSPGSNEVSIDSVLDFMHGGRFHYILLMLCGLSFMTDSMEVTLLSYISFCASAEWDLSGTETASVGSFIFLGITAGNILFGYLADAKGRRTAYLYGTGLLFLGGCFTSAAPNFSTLLVFRCIAGVGVGSSPVPFDLLAEFLPRVTRGEFLMLIELFWTLGTLYVAGTAWLLLETEGWRALVLASTLPVLLAFTLSVYLLPESPRWLLSQGRAEEAKAVLVGAMKMNNQRYKPFTLKSITSFDENPRKRSTSFVESLFSWEMLKIVLPLYHVWFVLGVGYYSYALILSRVFSDDNITSVRGHHQCSFDNAELFASASFEVVGVLVGVYLLHRQVNRNRVQAVFYGLTAACVLGLGLVYSTQSDIVNTMLASIGRMSVMVSTCMTWVATPELFHTEHRSFGHSAAVAMSRIGAFCAPYLVITANMPISHVAIVLAVLLVSAALAVVLLPEMVA